MYHFVKDKDFLEIYKSGFVLILGTKGAIFKL